MARPGVRSSLVTRPGVWSSLAPLRWPVQESGPPRSLPGDLSKGLVPPSGRSWDPVIPGRSPKTRPEVGPCPRSGPRGSGPGLGLPSGVGALQAGPTRVQGRGPGFGAFRARTRAEASACGAGATGQARRGADSLTCRLSPHCSYETQTGENTVPKLLPSLQQDLQDSGLRTT